MKKKLSPPHHKVYTRIKPSKINGVGVFAITPIKKGVPIFYNDEESEMVWIDKKEIIKLPTEIKRLYTDFCVLKKGKYGCPKNFSSMTIAWYLNHSDKPNVNVDEDYNFYAARNIKGGEELTVNYNTYSE